MFSFFCHTYLVTLYIGVLDCQSPVEHPKYPTKYMFVERLVGSDVFQNNFVVYDF